MDSDISLSPEVIAKPPGALAPRRQTPENCGHSVHNPAKPEGFELPPLKTVIVRG